MNRAIYCLKNEQSALKHAVSFADKMDDIDQLRILRKALREIDEALAFLIGAEKGDRMYEKLKGEK